MGNSKDSQKDSRVLSCVCTTPCLYPPPPSMMQFKSSLLSTHTSMCSWARTLPQTHVRNQLHMHTPARAPSPCPSPAPRTRRRSGTSARLAPARTRCSVQTWCCLRSPGAPGERTTGQQGRGQQRHPQCVKRAAGQGATGFPTHQPKRAVTDNAALNRPP